MAHTTNAIAVTCIDFRFQKFIGSWLHEHIGEGNYDRVAWAGGVIELASILKQLEISVRLHQIKQVFLINHEDCGAYGASGTPEKHAQDLTNAKAEIIKRYPNLVINLYYLHLDGTFEPIS